MVDYERFYTQQLVRLCQQADESFRLKNRQKAHEELSEALVLIQKLKTSNSLGEWQAEVDNTTLLVDRQLELFLKLVVVDLDFSFRGIKLHPTDRAAKLAKGISGSYQIKLRTQALHQAFQDYLRRALPQIQLGSFVTTFLQSSRLLCRFQDNKRIKTRGFGCSLVQAELDEELQILPCEAFLSPKQLVLMQGEDFHVVPKPNDPHQARGHGSIFVRDFPEWISVDEGISGQVPMDWTASVMLNVVWTDATGFHISSEMEIVIDRLD